MNQGLTFVLKIVLLSIPAMAAELRASVLPPKPLQWPKRQATASSKLELAVQRCQATEDEKGSLRCTLADLQPSRIRLAQRVWTSDGPDAQFVDLRKLPSATFPLRNLKWAGPARLNSQSIRSQLEPPLSFYYVFYFFNYCHLVTLCSVLKNVSS